MCAQSALPRGPQCAIRGVYAALGGGGRGRLRPEVEAGLRGGLPFPSRNLFCYGKKRLHATHAEGNPPSVDIQDGRKHGAGPLRELTEHEDELLCGEVHVQEARAAPNPMHGHDTVLQRTA